MNFTHPDNCSKELTIAIEASIAAAEISKKYFNGSFEVSIKDDKTPVTALLTHSYPELYHVHTVEGSCPIRRSQILGGGCRPE